MKTKKILLYFIVLLLIASNVYASSNWNAPTEIVSGYYGNIDISDDGSEIVAVENNYQNSNSLKLIYFKKSSSVWKSTILAENAVKSDFPLVETQPVISGDGNRIAYLGYTGTDNRIFELVKKADGTFSEPRVIDSIPSGWFSLGIDIDYDGDLLVYICGDGDGFFGGTATLYYVERNGEQWSSPKKIYQDNGTYPGASASPSLDKYGNTIAWVQYNSVGDVFVSKKTSNGFGAPVILTNTSEEEKYVKLSGDGNTVSYFRLYVENSTYTGKDLFVRRCSGGSWGNEIKINKVSDSVTSIYDSKAALNYTGTRLIYTHFFSSGDTTTHGRLSMSEYLNGSYSNPIDITDTTYMFDEEPQLSDDGKSLIYVGPYKIAAMTTDQAPPQDAEQIDTDTGIYKEWPSRAGIDTLKKWEIKFSKELDITTVNPSNIYVAEKDTKIIMNTELIVKDKSTVDIIPPISGYTKGKSYYIKIAGSLKDKNGNYLKTPVKMEFTIAE